jgi:hypothetical protein
MKAKQAAKMSEEECDEFIIATKALLNKAAIIFSEASSGKRRLNQWVADEGTTQ